MLPNVDCIRHKSITERVLKRRNSEHALQQAMNVARSRQERLVKLINEHQKLVKEVEKWSSLANVTAPPSTGSMESSRVLDESGDKEQSLPQLNISFTEKDTIQEWFTFHPLCHKAPWNSMIPLSFLMFPLWRHILSNLTYFSPHTRIKSYNIAYLWIKP